MPPTQGRIFEGVQGLRAVAALSVVILHVANEAGGFYGTPEVSPYPWTQLFPLGAGVDLFFVISGFVMAWTCWNAWGQPGAPGRFMARRLLRIVPLYWLLTAATVAAALLVPGEMSNGLRDGWAYVAASFLFVPWARSDGSVQPILRLGWTLNYEMAFYALLAASLPLRRALALPCLLACLALLVLLHPAAGPVPLAFWTDPLLLEFGLGLLVGIAARWGWRGGWQAALGAAITTAASAAIPAGTAHWIAFGIPCALLVFAALTIGRLPGWLRLLGDASYALYLVHPFPMRGLHIVFERLGLGAGGFVVAAVATSVVLAVALHRWVEVPILRLGRS